MNYQASQSGFILISLSAFASITIGLILLLGAGNLSTNLSSIQRAASLEAQALADAGLDQALHTLRANASFSGETFALGTGTVTTIIEANGLERIITASGQVQGILGGNVTRKRRIIAIADANQAGTAFTYAIQSDTGGFTTGANKNPAIDGNLYSNGDVGILGPGAKVTGNVSAAGTVTNRGTVDGTITEGAPVQPLPEIDVNGWKALAEEGQTHVGDLTIADNTPLSLGAPDHIGVITGRLVISANPNIILTGPVWVKGSAGSSIEISANPTLTLDQDVSQSVILADGSLTFSGNARFETQSDNSDLLVMTLAPGTYTPASVAVSVNANTRFVNAGLYAPNGRIEVGPSASGLSITSFTAAGISINSNAKIDYSEGLIDANFSPSGPTGGQFIVVAGSYQIISP